MEGTTTTWLQLWNSANTQKSQSQREIILFPGEQDFVPLRQEHPISKHAGLPHSHLVSRMHSYMSGLAGSRYYQSRPVKHVYLNAMYSDNLQKASLLHTIS